VKTKMFFWNTLYIVTDTVALGGWAITFGTVETSGQLACPLLFAVYIFHYKVEKCEPIKQLHVDEILILTVSSRVTLQFPVTKGKIYASSEMCINCVCHLQLEGYKHKHV